jgi:hypothetical protein
MNQKIRTSVFSVVPLKIPQMGESPNYVLGENPEILKF